MKIKMQFGIVKTLLLSLVAIVAVALIILDILLLAGVFGPVVNVPVASVSLGAGALILVADLVLLLGSYYTLGESGLKAVFGLVYSIEVPYTAVVNIRQNTATNIVTLEVANEDGSGSDIQLNLAGFKADAVAKEIALKSEKLVEYYSPENKNQK